MLVMLSDNFFTESFNTTGTHQEAKPLPDYSEEIRGITKALPA